jgi:putative transposase
MDEKPVREDPAAWTPERRGDVVLRVLRGEESIEEVADDVGIAASEVERWTGRFVEAGREALGREATPAYQRIRELERKLGEMALEMDRLRKRLNPA